MAVKLHYTKLPPRESDQSVFVADLHKVENLLQWKPVVSTRDGIGRMVMWIEDRFNAK